MDETDFLADPDTDAALDIPAEGASHGDADYVLGFLRDHPDFLQLYPDLLDTLHLRHESSGAVSLIERQIQGLRVQSEQQRARFDELLQIARQNDSLNQRVHRLVLELIDCDSRERLINRLGFGLQQEFRVQLVEIRLFDPPELARLSFFAELLEQEQPRCGRMPRESLVELFGDRASAIRSAVLLPLRGKSLLGVLALADQDPHRYHPGMATDYLARLAEIVSRLIQRCPARE